MSRVASLPPSAPTSDPKRDIDYAFDVHLHDGGMLPVNGVSALSDMDAALHVTPDKLDITPNHTAHRGKTIIKANGAHLGRSPAPPFARQRHRR